MKPFYDFSCLRRTWQKMLVQKDGRKWLLLINEFIWGDVILQSVQMVFGSRVGHVVVGDAAAAVAASMCAHMTFLLEQTPQP